VHTAGLIGGVAQRRPWDAVRTNVFGTTYVLEAARLAGATRIVYTTTHGVYDFDRCRDTPITEQSPTTSATVYGACKLSAENLLHAYSRAYDLDVIALRFTNIYGRGLYVGGSTGGEHFNALVEPVASGAPGRILPAVKGRGEWLYVKDAAQALTLAVERGQRDGYLLACIGTGVLSTHEDVMAAVRAVAPEARFEEVDTGPVHRAPERPQPYDLSHARQTLGYEPRWDLRAGVADYLDEVRMVLRARPATAGA
jgi:UDP-glucose 4-epimerase